MNAHTPTGLTPSAVHHGDLIRAIAAEPDGLVGTAAQVFRAAGRDPSVNKAASRDLGQLEEQGFITRDGEGAETRWTLTLAGQNARLALDVGQGLSPPVGGMPTLRHDQLRASPLNPRKDFDSEKAVTKRDELRQDIVQRGYLIQSLMVRPIDAEPGLYWIVAGENRFRAIGEAIADGDLPDDFPIPVQVRAMSDLEHLLTATAENIRRSDLNHLEEAQAFADAIAMGQTPQTLADAVGRTDRFIQEHIRVLNKASAEAKAAFLAGDSDWTTLRDSVKVPKHELALGKNPRLALLIVEIEVKARREGVDNETPMAIAAPPPGGVFADAEELGLLVRKPTPDNRLGVLLLPPAMEWLEDQGGDSSDDPARWDAFVRDTTAAALGEIGAMALGEGQFGTAFLNAEPAPPPKVPGANLTARAKLMLAELADKIRRFPDNTITDANGRGAWVSGDAASDADWLELEEDHLINLASIGRPDGSMSFKLTPIGRDFLDRRALDSIEALRSARISALGLSIADHDALLRADKYATPYLNQPEPDEVETDQPTVRPGLSGDSFSALVREASAAADDDDRENGGDDYLAQHLERAEPRSALAAVKDPDELDGPPALALVEIAFLVQEEPVTARGGAIAGARIGAYHLDKTGTATKLAMGGYISMIQAPTGLGYLAVPTQKANDWIAERYPHGISLDALEDLQALALSPREPAARFVTPWLNPEPEQARPAPPQAETPKAAPAAPAPDPVMLAFRTAFDQLWAAGSAVESAMEGQAFPPGTGDAFENLFAVLTAAQPFLSKE